VTEEFKRTAVILLVEDDEDDRWATMRAFAKGKFCNRVESVENGEEALSYLKNLGQYADAQKFPRPDIILLDLNMPIMDGTTFLKHVKEDPKLAVIPIVVLTTSSQEQDVLRSYNLGVNSYITKPVDFEKFIPIATELSHYWFELVVLPPKQ